MLRYQSGILVERLTREDREAFFEAAGSSSWWIRVSRSGRRFGFEYDVIGEPLDLARWDLTL